MKLGPRAHRRLLVWGTCVTVIAGFTSLALWQVNTSRSQAEREALLDHRVSAGSLLIVGGGVVTPAIRAKFVELSGGPPQARIVIIPASEPGPGDHQRWLAPWLSFNPQSVEVLHAATRATADDQEFCRTLERATGVWLGGGNQALLAERYAETLVVQRLAELLARKGVIGGTSAGAAAMSQVMIVDGTGQPTEGQGLGLFREAIVDQHFLRRNRMWRLQQMLTAHSDLVGFGIDERTALLVQGADRRLTVIGDSYVVACLPALDAAPTRFEILKPGDQVTLQALRDDHLPYHPEIDWTEVNRRGEMAD